MADIWVGKDEAQGIPVPPRNDLKPPPHWRLEAVAATERPRSLSLGADRRTAAFIQDRDTSDVWLLDVLDDPVPRRLTTGRSPMPLLGGHRAAVVTGRDAGRVRRRDVRMPQSPYLPTAQEAVLWVVGHGEPRHVGAVAGAEDAEPYLL